MEEELSGKLDDLKSVKESLKLEKDSVDTLMDKKTGQLKDYQETGRRNGKAFGGPEERD